MQSSIRTDLALEAEALLREQSPTGQSPEGVRAARSRRGAFGVTTVEVTSAAGEAALGKPMGTYITVELDALIRREENAFPEACALLADAGFWRRFCAPCCRCGPATPAWWWGSATGTSRRTPWGRTPSTASW